MVLGAAAVLVLGGFVFVAISLGLGDETHINKLSVARVVDQLDAAGLHCELDGRPMSGAGGLPFPRDNDYFEFAACRLEDGELLAIVTFHPQAPPDRPPCRRAEGAESPSGAWWVHQQSMDDAAGGLRHPQRPNESTLRSVAEALDGKYLDTC